MAAPSERVEKLANSVWLTLIARVSTAVLAAVALPALFGAINWASATNQALEDAKDATNLVITRVVVLENNSAIGRENRKASDAELKSLLQEQVRQSATIIERLARLEARFDAQDRRP